jgi:hypothetical protein
MKRLYLFLLLAVIVSTGFSQSLVLIYNGKEHTSTDTLQIDSVDPKLGMMKAVVRVKNTGTRETEVKVRKTTISVLTGSQTTFCWGTNCYAESIEVSQYPVAIKSNALDSSFYVEYLPTGNKTGKSIYKFQFFEVMNENSYVNVIVKFIEGKLDFYDPQSVEYFNVFASGNSGLIRVSYYLPAKSSLVVHNLAGKMVGEFPLPSEKSTLNLPFRLSTGLYICSVIRSNKIVLSKKLAVY